MEKYDYREESSIAGSVSAEIDDLSVQEALLVHEAIKTIKATTKEDNLKQGEEWFRLSILPTLKGYAQITGAVLEIDKMDSEIMTATLRSPNGFDISEQYRLLYLALMATAHISIEQQDHETLMILAYDIGHVSYD